MAFRTPIFNIQFSGDGPIVTTPSLDSMDNTTILEYSGDLSPTSQLSEECEDFLTSHGRNVTIASNVSDPAIRLVIASVTMAENLLVLIALLRSWRSLSQNIYIFALSIACSDFFLGFIHVTNSIIVRALTTTDKVASDIAIGKGPTSWFLTIRATALVSAQVASTGNGACLVLAFKRYVDALAPSGNVINESTSSDRNNETTSRLLSRKTCYKMTAGVWTLSLLLGVIPLFWNCGHDCACFIDAGIHYTDKRAAICFENHGCSYLFPPLKSVSYLIFVVLFFMALVVLVTSCIQVTVAAGGLIAFLPYRLHKYYVRRRRTSVESSIEPAQIPRRLRKRSVQITYMRDMMHFMILLSTTFVVCKLPSAILLFIESVTTSQLEISSTTAGYIVLLSYADSILNPIIFATTLHGMKEAFKKLIEPCCTKTISVTIGKQQHSSDATSSQPPVSTTTI